MRSEASKYALLHLRHDIVLKMEEINEDFRETDIVIVIASNDIGIETPLFYKSNTRMVYGNARGLTADWQEKKALQSRCRTTIQAKPIPDQTCLIGNARVRRKNAD
ncbi:hypothetical protein GR212_30980 [Rhizobium lusitanum]|uniref:Uncharacterized protein n=2 Tax=Rhizobium lusitanum TaxID=293958 RepID=A0A6L9UIM7_9HYPH|nr:hypothetical protein [Rhizobium lusitanum]